LLYLDQTLVVAPQSAFAQTLRLKYQPDNSMPIQPPAFGIADRGFEIPEVKNL
jgi:hypothetical protein